MLLQREWECYDNLRYPIPLRALLPRDRGAECCPSFLITPYHRTAEGSPALPMTASIGRRGWGIHTAMVCAKGSSMKQRTNEILESQALVVTHWPVSSSVLKSQQIDPLTMWSSSQGWLGHTRVIHGWRGRVLPKHHRTNLQEWT